MGLVVAMAVAETVEEVTVAETVAEELVEVMGAATVEAEKVVVGRWWRRYRF